mgnify:CR=1 FL=1
MSENMAQKKIPKLEELNTSESMSNSNNINKITDKIYLGDEEGALDFEFLKSEQIKNVLSIVNNPPTYPKELGIIHKVLQLEDKLSLKIIPYFKECIEFIENSDKILVHCSCGINRSPTFVIAYLIWKTQCDFSKVYNFVKSRRPCIEPNLGFIKQLQKFDNLLKKNNYVINKIVFSL